MPDLQHTVSRQLLDRDRNHKVLDRMMAKLAEEIVSKGVAPKQESLRWTRTYAKDAEEPVVIEGRWEFWVLFFVKKFDIVVWRKSRGRVCEPPA